MRSFVIFAACLVAVAQAGNIDWSQVKIRDIDPVTKQYVYSNLNRIVGGQEASPGSIPYQAALVITTPDGRFFCGGSLISANYLMTAAHCVDSATSVDVILGAHKYQEVEENMLTLVVESQNIRVHPGWSLSTLMNDIAVLKFDKPIILTKYIQLISLPKYSDIDVDFSTQAAKVSGWGKDSDSATTTSPVLRYVYTDVITNKECQSYYGEYVHDSNICVSGVNGQGSCNGDSGGPLAIGIKQIGIVSYGSSTGCEKGFPSAFSRTTHFLDWLAANTDAVILH